MAWKHSHFHNRPLDLSQRHAGQDFDRALIEEFVRSATEDAPVGAAPMRGGRFLKKEPVGTGLLEDASVTRPQCLDYPHR